MEDKVKSSDKGKESLKESEGSNDAIKKFNDFISKRVKNSQKMSKLKKKLTLWNSPKTEEEANKYIELLRMGGVDEKKDMENPNERHIRLAAAYLRQIDGEPPSYKVDFGDDEIAYHRLGAGDILSHCFTVCEFDTQKMGNVTGIRTRNPATGREGFYVVDDLKNGIYTYIPIFTGDTIHSVSSEKSSYIITSLKENLTNEQDKKNLSAFTGARASFASHIAIYNEDAAKDEHSEPVEMLLDPVTGQDSLNARRQSALSHSKESRAALMEV